MLDASNAITYTNCNKGFAVFGQSSSSRNFPQMSYTPMCAYAVNYVFREPSVQVATPNQITRKLSTKSTSAAVATVVIYLKRTKSDSTPTASLKPGTPSSKPTASVKPATPSSTYTEPVKPSLEARADSQPVAPSLSTSCSSNSNHQHSTASNSINNQKTTGKEESDALPRSYEEAIRLQNSEEVNIYLEIIKFTSFLLRTSHGVVISVGNI